jgi:hypothetical protein
MGKRGGGEKQRRKATCKMLEHIICSSIMKHLDHHEILHDAHHGFRKQRSYDSQLVPTIQDLAKNTDMKDQTGLALSSWIFPRPLINCPTSNSCKIHFYGIRNSVRTWIVDFLGGRIQQVLLEGVKSNSAPVQSGVPQGSVLGPLLFLLFNNDLPEVVSEQSTVRLFADDCALYMSIRCTENAAQLQEDMRRLQNWERKWMMEFHPKKCQVLNIIIKRNIIRHP